MGDEDRGKPVTQGKLAIERLMYVVSHRIHLRV